MKLSQKRAISYAISERQRKRREAYIIANGLQEGFARSKYKTMYSFLRSQVSCEELAKIERGDYYQAKKYIK